VTGAGSSSSPDQIHFKLVLASRTKAFERGLVAVGAVISKAQEPSSCDEQSVLTQVPYYSKPNEPPPLYTYGTFD